MYSREVRDPKLLADIGARPARARPPLLATDPWFVALKEVCIYQHAGWNTVRLALCRSRASLSSTPHTRCA